MGYEEVGSTKFHIELLQKSITSLGNNNRMKRAIQKSRNGEEVTLVYLGASITMKRSKVNDTGYATLSYEFYRDYFGKSDKVTYINSGLNGTSSTIGLIRVDRDVLEHKPDIVFVEFAVNDSKDSMSREMFESLILRLLQSESKPAVVLLFMSSETGYSCQGHMQVIGEHYGLPMISINDAVISEITENRMTWRDYSDDNIHPNDAGNRLVAECIAHYYKLVDSMEPQEEYALPDTPFFGNSFLTMKLLDSDNVKNCTLGCFHKGMGSDSFRNRWVYHRGNGKKSFKMKLKCKSLFVVYKENNSKSEGNAQIYVDGRLKGIMTGYRVFGWGNPAVLFVFQEQSAKEHTIEVKMDPQDVGKDFTLLAFGYCD